MKIVAKITDQGTKTTVFFSSRAGDSLVLKDEKVIGTEIAEKNLRVSFEKIKGILDARVAKGTVIPILGTDQSLSMSISIPSGFDPMVVLGETIIDDLRICLINAGLARPLVEHDGGLNPPASIQDAENEYANFFKQTK